MVVAATKNFDRWAIALFAILLAGAFAFSPNFGAYRSDLDSPFAGDFLQEWIGGYVVWHQGADQLYDDAAVQRLQHDASLVGFSFDENSYFVMVYPPFYYTLLSPLSLLSYSTAAWLFAAAMSLCLMLAIALIAYAQPERKLARWVWLLPLAMLFTPLIESLTSGQKGTLCLLILCGAFFLLKRERSFSAGVVFGLLAFKPQLALVIGIAMLCKRQFRFALGAMVTVSIYVAICLAGGIESCWQFADLCLGVGEYAQRSGYDLHKSHCLLGFVTLLAGGESSWQVKGAVLLLMAAAVAMLSRLLRGKLDLRGDRFNVQFAAMVIGSLLLSPHLFTYDLTLLLLPMVLLLRPMHDKTSVSKPILILVIALFVASGLSAQWAQTTSVQITTIAMMALLMTLAYPFPLGSTRTVLSWCR